MSKSKEQKDFICTIIFLNQYYSASTTEAKLCITFADIKQVKFSPSFTLAGKVSSVGRDRTTKRLLVLKHKSSTGGKAPFS